MLYLSTRGDGHKVSSAEAIRRGLAPDGGLYLPESLPSFSLDEIVKLSALSYPERAAFVLSRFLTDYTYEELLEYANKAYASFQPDVITLTDSMHILELYHGPTCAFKDFALQMLPYLLTGALKKTGESRTAVILTATSGDTGKAALEGFADVPGTRIAVFYPEGGTSRIQQLQMTTQEGSNVNVIAVKGNFDDAQTGVKQLFSDPELAKQLSDQGYFFSSANSINWGRLAPQIAFYFSAYADLVAAGRINGGELVNIVVPTGNFGNILASYLAYLCGLPVKTFLCASNRNNVLTDFIRTGQYNANRPFYLTASPSMDILVSSNLERLLYLLSEADSDAVAGNMRELKEKGFYGVSDAVLGHLQEKFSAGCADDKMTKETILRTFKDHRYLIDTHTAVAVKVYEDYARETGDQTPSIIASTASPFKFPKSILEALEQEVPADGFDQLRALEQVSGLTSPASLSSLENKPERFTKAVAPEDMKEAILAWL